MASVYPFDPSGTSTANRVLNEQHIITSQNFRDYHYVIPHFAPFFEGNFTVSMKYPNGTSRVLRYGVDFYFSNQFIDASKACAKPVYGSISFLDTDTSGVMTISYNTVGGMWNISRAEIMRILAEEMRNPRITTWEQITYLPQRFPVVDHEWDLVDMVGASSMVEAIDAITAAILASSGGGLNEHINNFSNPHNVTKSQVGLGDVQNFPIATLQQARDGTSASSYMTPVRVAEAIQTIGGALFNTHSSNTNNPHNTTKAQVGLGNVLNYAVASQVQAEAGTLDTVYMTPLKTAQAIAALVGNGFASHIANKQNPHNVTKEQVGLFNLENYPVATAEEARAGRATDRYMTPLRTTQLVQELVTVSIDGHATRTDNPHGTTASQVGAYSKVETDSLMGGYVRLTDEWVAGQPRDVFIADVRNGQAADSKLFDGKTIEQVIGSGVTTYDNRYIGSVNTFSRDKTTTLDPAATPHRWISLGVIGTLSSLDTNIPTAIALTAPDVYWFMTGGHAQKATAEENMKASSPGFLIHAKNGKAADAITFDVTRMNGDENSDVEFGYTYDETYGSMKLWVKVAYAYNDIMITRLTMMVNSVDFSNSELTTEPEGIVYAEPTSFGNNKAIVDLSDRVKALEDTLNSVTVE